MRTGMVLKKIGMTHIYADDGRHQSVTVLKNEGCQVLGTCETAVDGYQAVRIGAGSAKPKNIAKPQRVFYEKEGLKPSMQVVEFRTDGELPEKGKQLSTGHFIAGQYVDASAQSIGKGFAGAMKRWNFSGLRATHGVSISHRSHGSTGQCQDPGKVFKGKKMAGHMGAKRITTQNLKIVKVDTELELVFVKGAVPGSRGGWVLLRDAVKRALPKDAPLPAGFIDAVEAKVSDDVSAKEEKIEIEAKLEPKEETEAKPEPAKKGEDK